MAKTKKSRTMMNIICTLLAASLILLTCACAKRNQPPVSAETVLQAMLDGTTPPDGRFLSLTSADKSKRLSADLLTALYGTPASKWYQSGAYSVVNDGAIYLSEVMHPFELAVFRCINEGDVSGGMASVLGVCSTRLETIRAAWQGSDYEVYVQNAVVTYCDGYVLLVVAEDPDAVVKAAEKVIRSR